MAPYQMEKVFKKVTDCQSLIIDKRENELGTSTAVVRAFKYAAFGGIMLHLTSCVWYSLSCPNQADSITTCSDHTWAVKLNTGSFSLTLGETT